jgi:uncharacterized protein DUF4337
MVDSVEAAQEQLEKAHAAHGTHKEGDHWARWMAVVVSCLAASLALVDLGAKSSQTAYLTHNITASDTWSAYQGKNLRANLWNTQAVLLQSLPNAADPPIQERIKTAMSEAARMRDEPAAGDGMKQLKLKAEEQERERDHAFHAYHGFEYTSSALQISIVLASISVVTRVHVLGIVAAGIGSLAAGYGLAVFGHLF